MSMLPIQVFLKKELLNKFKQILISKNLKISEVIRQMISDYIKKEEENSNEVNGNVK